MTEDVFDIVLPENYGRITIDLNSHAIRGSDATDDDYAGDAITVSKVGVNNMPLALTFVGSGSVVGGTGCEMNTDGGYAISVEDYVDTLSLTVGEQVTVQGGKGWSASDDSGSDYSGCGGYGIYFCDCTGTFTLVNAGTVAGGDGGDYLGELTIDLNGHSARGSNATAEDDATSALVFSLAENDAPFVLKLVGTGTVVGGSGQEGLDGSDGTSAIEVGGAGVMSVVVDEGATVQGGKGADAPMVPGRGAPAIGVGTSATFEGCTGAGVVVAGADGGTRTEQGLLACGRGRCGAVLQGLR